ncbi:MAG: endonuclease Q family protein [Candidatus Methanofastidiosia archaeon]
MELNIDLHSHSGYAGGVGKTSLEDVEKNMPLKGIDVVGTGDCLHPLWRRKLGEVLVEEETGIFSYVGGKISYILQTEVIFTAAVGAKRKSVHNVILFPSFEAVDNTLRLFEKWGMKNTVGRPFLICGEPNDVAEKFFKICSVNDLIEIIPAHVMTPEGVFGSKVPIDSLKDFYGEAAEEINAIETGLSADPTILSLIPELDDIAFVSNSDAHSPALNRMGREFTTIDSKLNYPSILSRIRKNRINGTAEFNPMEGRFFLTGHRDGRKGHCGRYCVFSPQYTPEDTLCPICGRRLTVGVLERALQLSKIQGAEREVGTVKTSRNFVHMVPLVEIVAHAIGTSNISSAKVLDEYKKITGVIRECKLWFENEQIVEKRLSGIIDQKIIDAILAVKREEFCFHPPGYDGVYGKLIIGEKKDHLAVNIVT